MFVYKLLIHNELKIFRRKTVNLVKHHLIFFVIALVMLFYSLYSYQTMSFNDSFLYIYHRLLFSAILLGIMLYGFVERKSVMKIHHANLLYLDDTQITAFIKFELIKKIMLCMFLTLFMNLFFYEDHISKSILFFLVVIFQNVLSVYCYNIKYVILSESMRVFTCFILCFSYAGSISYAFLILLILVQMLLLKKRFNIEDFDRNLYYEEMEWYDKVQSAARNNDFFEMQIINNALSAYKRKKYTFFKDLTFDNALCQKIVLTLRRTDLKTIIILSFLCYIGLTLNSNFLVNQYLTIIIVFIGLININNSFKLQLKKVLDRHHEGLFLDYEYKYIIKIYTLINLIIYTLFLIGCAAVLTINVIKFIVAGVICFPVIFFEMYISSKRNSRLCSTVSNMCLLLIIGCCIFFA